MLKLILALIGLSLSLSANAAVIISTDYVLDSEQGLRFYKSDASVKGSRTVKNSELIELFNSSLVSFDAADFSQETADFMVALGSSIPVASSPIEPPIPGLPTPPTIILPPNNGYSITTYFSHEEAGITIGINPSNRVSRTYTYLEGADGLWSMDLSLYTLHLNTIDSADLRLAESVTVSAIPLPAPAWLFGSALLGLVGFKRKK